MKRIVIALMACLLLAGCSTARASQEDALENQGQITLAAIARDIPAPKEPVEAVHEEPATEPESEGEAEQAAEEPEPECEYQDWECYTLEAVSDGEWYAAYNELYGDSGPTHEMPGWHDGRVETYYSSNVLYHYRTGEWTVDEEGFYRTDEGYYVVGVSTGDYELGDTFEGGKGTCIVMDYGDTSQPVTDYYTNW